MHFTIRVWGDAMGMIPELKHWDAWPFPRKPICEIEVDITTYGGELTITNHRGLDLIPQKMLTQ